MGLRAGLSAAAVVAYLAGCWWLMSFAANAPWAVAAVFGPWLLPLLGAAWQQRRPSWAWAAAGGALLLLAIVAAGGLGDVRRLYLAQHMGMHLLVGWGFARTLRPGQVPLITAMARRVHRDARPMEAYTAKLTRAWVAYFFGMAALSALLYAVSWPAWTLLANVLTPLSLVGFFVVEYLLRYRWHPEFERVSIRQMIDAAQSHPPSVRAPRSTGS